MKVTLTLRACLLGVGLMLGAADALAQSVEGEAPADPSLIQPLVQPSQQGNDGPPDIPPAGSLASPKSEYRPITLSSMPAPMVVELFTSEGCSSCPPADALLGELAQRQYVLPLSFHVDYWDYIGWKDKFADPQYTRRQQAYAEAQGSSMVYTPQMIVAGAIDVVGSDRKAVEQALKTAYTRNTMYKLHVMREPDGKVVVQFPAANIGVPATVWLVTYQKSTENDVKGGENAGRNLKSYNVVRSLKKVGVWNGAATEMELTLDEPEGDAKPDACAIIANQAEHGPIIAAASFNYGSAW